LKEEKEKPEVGKRAHNKAVQEYADFKKYEVISEVGRKMAPTKPERLFRYAQMKLHF
jgi:hypothetical protein